MAVANQPTNSVEAEESLSNSNYPANFFTQYQPQNAFDMVERLPGFSFDGGSSARGFGGNAGNVLIDGARPTSKSGGLSGALKRIPAEQVERIDIIRGGVGAGEASGQTVVANIVKRKNVTSGTWAFKTRRAPDGTTKPNIEAAISTHLGEWESMFDIDLGFGPGYRTNLITKRDADDVVTDQTTETMDSLGRFTFSNAQLAREFDQGHLTLNGRLGTDKWTGDFKRLHYDGVVTDPADVSSEWELAIVNRYTVMELGANWAQEFEQWKWRSLGLFQVEERENNSADQDREGGIITNYGDFKRERTKKEFIVRNTFAYNGSNAFKPEYGIELAKNSLETQLDKTENGQLQSLTNANVTVEEIRGELFASFSYAQSDALTLEGGLTAEFSTIEVTGEDPKEQNFSFIKPRLSASYELNPSVRLSLTAEHVVGQLNFDDFAASTSSEDDRDVSGNSALVPDQSSDLTAVFDWSFSEKGSLKLEAFHYWQDDVYEEIEFASSTEEERVYGLGNAGKARVWGVKADLNLPIDAVLKNGLVELSYDYQDSKFYDEIIANHRPVSDYVPNNLRIKFRQDITEQQWAWGGEFYRRFTNKDYLVDQVSTFKGNDRLRIFAETTYFDGLKIQLEMHQANVGKFTRIRNFYEGTRNGEYTGYEVSQRRREPEYKLSVWGTF
ncbi:TonB-dependent siderophore receptor [Psychrobium sp. 1_MG-2023]|uniref:TonB-dependent receptor plug domain-containing protein n=1 Tax=Psychrobium sp. 1_MG-2023 TaxID=3062624 RepID=UPI0026781036|nr:TonB-dependent receptor plug domain-containing protein [Psychrobium sp. 1_MG-2023]MDP2560077.1 TonB-dependent receptor [Psychrobium sp. 1_MG-2023]